MYKNLKFCFIILYFYTSPTLGLLPTEIQVKTPNGEIKGQERNHYIAFEGIPYAEPPNNDLRFEPPVPFKSNVSLNIFK